MTWALSLTVMFPCPATTSMEKLWRPRRECSSFLVAIQQERGCHLGGPDSVWLQEAFWDESNQTKNAWGRGVEDYSFLPLKNGRTFPLWNDLMSLILGREINQRPKFSPGTTFSMKERGFRELGDHLNLSLLKKQGSRGTASLLSTSLLLETKALL